MSEPVHEIGNKVITHTVKGVGTFYLTASQDEQYPGVDIELIPEKNSKFDTGGTNPRILFEVLRPRISNRKEWLIMMTLTSAQANKLLGKLNDNLASLQNKERQTCAFNAALSEDIESVRPKYDYTATQVAIDEISDKIRKVKHAINVFNTTTIVPELNMTIDEVLVLIPQLTRQRCKLNAMKSRLPKERVQTGVRNSNIIDYVIANYDIAETERDYESVSDYLAKVQTALDVVNTTVTFEIDVDV